MSVTVTSCWTVSNGPIRILIMMTIGCLTGFVSSFIIFASETQQWSLKALIYTGLRDELVANKSDSETERVHRGAITVSATHHLQYQTVNKSRDRVTHRLLCLVFISTTHHEDHLRFINTTWGKRCDVTLYANGSTAVLRTDTVIDGFWDSSRSTSLSSSMTVEYNNTEPTYSFIYHSQGGATDWFLVADDHTYVVIDNLRHMLTSHSPDSLIYFTVDQRNSRRSGTFSGTYIMSRAAFHKLVTQFSHNTSSCRVIDIECLDSCGIHRGITVDSSGFETFHTVSPQRLVIPQWLVSTNEQRWSPFQHFPVKCGAGRSRCSNRSAVFTGLAPSVMQVIDFLINGLELACIS